MALTYSIEERILRQAATCSQMGSPFYGELLRSLAEEYGSNAEVRELLDRHEHRSRIALRFAGAAHYRALHGDSPEIAAHFPSTAGDGDARAAWNAAREDALAHAGVYDELLERPVQTNEVARAMPVLGAMLYVAAATNLPVRIFEIGSSAGLISQFDRYGYAGEDWSWGNSHSPLLLQNSTRSGKPAHLEAAMKVVERTGCDLHPLDASNPSDADTLLSFVWPDQTERFQRLRAALNIAKRHSLHIAKADGISWLGRRAAPQHGFVTVAMHTVMTEHMTHELREDLRRTVASIGMLATREAPFAWVRMEPGDPGYETSVALWPANTDTVIACSDGHAQNLEWTGA